MPYNSQNSFVCASCQQYNGFEDDGDYNKDITEQHHSRLNSPNDTYCQKTYLRLPAINGFCDTCNRNQEMKVIQLANFKARCEAKYDEEIEEYRQKIEDSYQLCQQCQRHLNKTLNRVKTKLIGSKISQIISKDFQSVNQKTSPKDRKIFTKITILLIFVLSVVNLVRETGISLDFIRRALENQFLMNIYYHFAALRLTVVDLFGLSWLKQLDIHKFIDTNTDSVAVSAVILNFLTVGSQKLVRFHIVASLLLWSMKMMLSEIAIDPSYILAVKGSIAGILVIISLHMLVKSGKTVKPTLDQSGTSFRKIHSEIIDDSEDECDISGSISNFDVRSSKYSPSVCNNMSRMLVKPAATFPLVNKMLHNSTLVRNRTDAIDTSVVGSKSVRNFDNLSNRSYSVRQEVTAADRNQVQKDINKLNISGSLLGSTSTLKDISLNQTLNPFSLENSRCGSPTPSINSVFSGSYRSQAISPPRLEPSFAGEASWVAGGYWSSPQKRCPEVHSFNKTAELSRSSSQSSGLGTIGSEKNSRENSVGHEEFSVFSEPVRRRNIFEKRTDTKSLFGQSFAQPQRNNFFLNNTTNNHLNAANSFRQYRESNASFFK